MFCPECKAEFRAGFTQCSDCGIALVNVPPNLEDRFRSVAEAAPTEYNELLVRTRECRLYLGLLATLANFRVRCYGKAANPATSDLGVSTTNPEFEIWIPKVQSRLAAWIRDSFQENHTAAEKLDLDKEQVTLGAATEAPDSAKLCALCSAEYASAATLCENCGTTLFWGKQALPRGELARTLFNEAQPQILGALRTALLEHRIPFNNGLLYQEGLLRGNSTTSSREIVVREVDFDRAKEVLARILERYEFEPTSGLRPSVDPTELYWPYTARRNGWLPEDLAQIAWTGHNFFTLSAAAGALREHRVPYRADAEDLKTAKLLVHPDDASRAREVLQEVEEGPDTTATESSDELA